MRRASRRVASGALAGFAALLFAAKVDAQTTADERAAFEHARDVFERYCASCHSRAGAHADAEALEHLDMTQYPFTGHHADEAGAAVREALGASGEAATMPRDHPGVVRGEELARVMAWADAFDRGHPAQAGGAGGMRGMGGMGAGGSEDGDVHAHDHDHEGEGAGGEGGMRGMGEHGSEQGQLAYPYPRMLMIPGNPGMAGGIHVMVNGFAQVQNVGLGGYRIDNPGAGSFDGGATTPLLTDDWAMIYGRDAHGWLEGLLMLDFEPLTVGPGGYPELGQSGEGLWDAQHAHDLVHQAMVAVHPFAHTHAGGMSATHEGVIDLAIFAGQGSATIGPPIFMHRGSSPGPTVPRKHHKGENPHETFPVLGASFRIHSTWLEASAFNARELTPQDSRLYPHFGPPVSFAARIRQELYERVELQVSAERLRDQGSGEPDAWQVSASAYAWGHFHDWRFDLLADWAIDMPDAHPSANAFLVEAALRDPTLRETLWARVEFNQREERPEWGGFVSTPWVFDTLGFEHVVVADRASGMQIGVFGEATYARIPDSLEAHYGRTDAVTLNIGLHVFGMWMLDGSLHRMEAMH